jgi:hypothetical protein
VLPTPQLLHLVNAHDQRQPPSCHPRTRTETEVDLKTETKRFSPAKLLTGDLGHVVKKKGRADSDKSKKAARIKVASKGPLSNVTRTNKAEVWLPLQGAGPDARVLVTLQGARRARDRVGDAALRCTCCLGKDGACTTTAHDKLPARHAQAGRRTVACFSASVLPSSLYLRAGNLGEQRYLQLNPFQQTAKVTEGLATGTSEVTNGIMSNVQALGRKIASALFD